MGEHIPRERLLEYIDSDLTAAESLHVEHHVKSCAACRTKLARLQDVDQQLSRNLKFAAEQVKPASLNEPMEMDEITRMTRPDHRWLRGRRSHGIQQAMNRVRVSNSLSLGVMILSFAVFIAVVFIRPLWFGQDAIEGGGPTEQPAPTSMGTVAPTLVPIQPDLSPVGDDSQSLQMTATVFWTPAEEPTVTPTATLSRGPIVTTTAIPSREPTVTTTATPSSGLPDLVFSPLSFRMEGYELGQCVVDYGEVFTTFCVKNQGAGAAGPFTVRISWTSFLWGIGGLSPGEVICAEIRGAGWGDGWIDPANAVTEADETNNQIMIPVLTPPPLCTPVPVTPTP